MADSLVDALSRMERDNTFSDSPRPGYSKAGDCLFLYFDPAESYADRVDGILTVYRAFDDDRIVGFQVKGISHLVKQIGQYGYHFDEQVELSLVLLIAGFKLDESDENDRAALYRDLIARSRSEHIPLQELESS